jgi:RNA polymerase sigma factor (sigma-70 family)
MNIDTFEEFSVEIEQELLTSIQSKIESDSSLSLLEKDSMCAIAEEIINSNPEISELVISEQILRGVCNKYLNPEHDPRVSQSSEVWASTDYIQESILEELTPDEITNYLKNFVFLSTHDFPIRMILKTKGLLTSSSEEVSSRLQTVSVLPNFKQILVENPFLLSDQDIEAKVSTIASLPKLAEYNSKTIARICKFSSEDLSSFLKTIIGYPHIAPEELEDLVDTPIALESLKALSSLESEFRANPELKMRLTSEQEHTLFKTLKDEIPQIKEVEKQKSMRNRIVSVIFQTNRRLIFKVMKKYGVFNNGSTSEDYYLDGEDGLLHAIGVFDYERGTAFSTVAYIWIEQAVSRAFYENQHDGVTKIPDTLGMSILRFKRLQKDYGANLTYQELSALAQEKGYEIPTQEEFETFGSALRLDSPLKSESDTYTTLGEILNIHNGNSPESTATDRIFVEELMSIFSPLYQQIIYLSALGYNNKEIADLYKCSTENIRQKLAAAVKMAREFVKKHSTQESFDLPVDI